MEIKGIESIIQKSSQDGQSGANTKNMLNLTELNISFPKHDKEAKKNNDKKLDVKKRKEIPSYEEEDDYDLDIQIKDAALINLPSERPQSDWSRCSCRCTTQQGYTCRSCDTQQQMWSCQRC